jgi:hypothetical protein
MRIFYGISLFLLLCTADSVYGEKKCIVNVRDGLEIIDVLGRDLHEAMNKAIEIVGLLRVYGNTSFTEDDRDHIKGEIKAKFAEMVKALKYITWNGKLIAFGINEEIMDIVIVHRESYVTSIFLTDYKNVIEKNTIKKRIDRLSLDNYEELSIRIEILRQKVVDTIVLNDLKYKEIKGK